jgi:hypothetical protein
MSRRPKYSTVPTQVAVQPYPGTSEIQTGSCADMLTTGVIIHPCYQALRTHVKALVRILEVAALKKLDVACGSSGERATRPSVCEHIEHIPCAPG